jgi:formate hydrogenlyase transcriptional activator
VILSEGETLAVDQASLKREQVPTRRRTGTLNGALKTQEREIIEAALAESRGRISGPEGAATRLGLPAQTLESKIKRLRIEKYRFKAPHTG